MKKLMIIFLLLGTLSSRAQNYNNILNYNLNGTPTYGVKIKTNLPFTPATQMPTISILGYSYGPNQPISLTLTYYIYSGGNDFNDPANYYVHHSMVSSSGSYTPPVYISNESGKVVIYIDDKAYFQRFTVSAFAQGMSEVSSWFTGWTAADEALTGTKTVLMSYSNRFKGDVMMPSDGIWNASGNVGIGTVTPIDKLSVNGRIRAQEVKVENGNWPDYVFEKSYALSPLEEIEKHIQQNGHLPGIPSAAEVKANGIDLGEMNAKLLKKIEELTLYMIDLKKENDTQRKEIIEIQSRLKAYRP